MILFAMMLLQAAAPAPSTEAAQLGSTLAMSGTFSRIAPMMAEQQAAEIGRDTHGLTSAEQAELRAVAKSTAATRVQRITSVMAAHYARTLSVADMRAVIAFNTTDAAARYRAAEPGAIAAASQAAAGIDFKKEVMAAFCAKTGKGCAPTK